MPVNARDDFPAAPATSADTAGRVPHAVSSHDHDHDHDDGAVGCRLLASNELFLGADEVRIAHRGAIYRLKVTSLGKLILTK